MLGPCGNDRARNERGGDDRPPAISHPRRVGRGDATAKWALIVDGRAKRRGRRINGDRVDRDQTTNPPKVDGRRYGGSRAGVAIGTPLEGWITVRYSQTYVVRTISAHTRVLRVNRV